MKCMTLMAFITLSKCLRQNKEVELTDIFYPKALSSCTGFCNSLGNSPPLLWNNLCLRGLRLSQTQHCLQAQGGCLEGLYVNSISLKVIGLYEFLKYLFCDNFVTLHFPRKLFISSRFKVYLWKPSLKLYVCCLPFHAVVCWVAYSVFSF